MKFVERECSESEHKPSLSWYHMTYEKTYDMVVESLCIIIHTYQEKERIAFSYDEPLKEERALASLFEAKQP